MTAGEANPTPEIVWYKDKVEFTDGVVNSLGEHVFGSYGSISVLTLIASRQDNDIIYRCEIKGNPYLKTTHEGNVDCK